MTVVWRDAPSMNGGYVLDIADANGKPIVQGIPFVTGADLLAQYAYLGIGGQLIVQTDYDLHGRLLSDESGSHPDRRQRF